MQLFEHRIWNILAVQQPMSSWRASPETPEAASPSTVADAMRGTPRPPDYLRVSKLRKTFGGVEALKDVDLQVAQGEFLTLLGPSGSGKTTLLRLLGGFEYPTAGSIHLGGRDVAHQPAYKRNIGMVFQKYALFPHMTVFDNVAFPLRRRGLRKGELGIRVAEALDMVSLQGFDRRYPRELSGGQQQRVALARAMVFHPEILLMDEPLGALDKQLRDHMQREIRALQQRIGITTVYVTHDQSEAMQMSDRVAIMNNGRIEQVGTPRDLYERPATEFVVRFVGDSNLLHVDGVATSAEGSSASGRGGARLVCASGFHAPAGQPAKLLVRPEKIRLSTGEAPPAADNVLRGQVQSAIYLGDCSVYTVECAAGLLTVRMAHRHGEPAIQAGDSVHASWSAHDCSFLV